MFFHCLLDRGHLTEHLGICFIFSEFLYNFSNFPGFILYSLDFNYNLDLDKEVSGNYSYYIKGTVTANRENSDSKFYTKDYILKDVKTESYTDKENINIKDSIDVDYDIYNNVLTSFRDEYGVQMDGNLKVSLIVENNVKDSVSGESTSLKNETDIDIPLTTLTVEVPIESNDKTDSGVLFSSI